MNKFLRERFYLSTEKNEIDRSRDASGATRASALDDAQPSLVSRVGLRSPRSTRDLSRKESLQQLVDKLCDPRATSSLSGSRFMELTKKMRQQIMSKLLSRLRNQLVAYNVKALLRIYMIFHRDDRLIHTICDLFAKQRVYNLQRLRREIIGKNTKPYQRKLMRNKLCNEVMRRNPNLLRLFDNRMLNYYDKMLREANETIHAVSSALPVIVCLNESDVDKMIDECRNAYSRQVDFPLHLLPHSMRLPFARLFEMYHRR